MITARALVTDREVHEWNKDEYSRPDRRLAGERAAVGGGWCWQWEGCFRELCGKRDRKQSVSVTPSLSGSAWWEKKKENGCGEDD